MKRIFKPDLAPLAVLFGGVAGFLLRLWTLGSGPDEQGLYEPMILPWCLLVMVSLAVAAVILLSISRLKDAGKYADHFPASKFGAATHILAAIGVLLSTFRAAEGTSAGLWMITVALGIGSTICLSLGALARLNGNRPPFWLHAVPCLFLALRSFLYCRAWGNVTQTGVFLFPFLASIFIIFAMYQLTCYDVDLGHRLRNLFWSLYGCYLCIISLAFCDDVVFYLSMGLFLLTNHCRLQPIHRPKSSPDEQA